MSSFCLDSSARSTVCTLVLESLSSCVQRTVYSFPASLSADVYSVNSTQCTQCTCTTLGAQCTCNIRYKHCRQCTCSTKYVECRASSCFRLTRAVESSREEGTQGQTVGGPHRLEKWVFSRTHSFSAGIHYMPTCQHAYMFPCPYVQKSKVPHVSDINPPA